MTRTFLVGVVMLFIALPAATQDLAKAREIYAVCSSCHGENGRATTVPQYPVIAGQNRAYLSNALKAYRDGKRQGTYASMMAAATRTLTDEEISALADYIAALK
ncbi:c-type cytochrome [Achromobacter seleniivolatilans]|uniref:C-type cytochrome n=1 Tax=Achromobacter seleniivolatilans TaxID=3047478 RepID=A0ABY9LWE4_9BURK|nr:c-type cytochrome [Achromobacter sp. R39]WMD18313.1 c-type cytochrome [Achromobacter sp. R39]